MAVAYKITTILTLLALSTPAWANSLSYSLFDIGWYKRDYDDSRNDTFDLTGFRARLSVDVQSGVFFLLGADRVRIKKEEIFPGLFIEGEGTTYTGGIGYRVPIEKRIHAVMAAEAVKSEAEITISSNTDSATGKDDESGWQGSLGVRALPFPKLELAAGVRYEDISDDADTVYELGASLYLTGRLHLLVGADFLDTAKDIRVGLRWAY